MFHRNPSTSCGLDSQGPHGFGRRLAAGDHNFLRVVGIDVLIELIELLWCSYSVVSVIRLNPFEKHPP